ncbi:ATP-binding protein [Phenylobacterium sp.]|uniref:ATP-binding protein n=1 Tax=Phenylobacterium sp. TaxID=1871053 RepID=UPI002ED7C196
MHWWSPRASRATADAPSGRPRWLDLALDRIPADEEEAAQIRGAQIHAIVRLTPVVMTASCVNSLILLAVLASTGTLRAEHLIWAAGLLAMALAYLRGRLGKGAPQRRPASRRAIRRATVNGAVFGAIWAIVPAAWFVGAPLQVQLFVACLTAGMLSGGAFVLATVPLAAMSYVSLLVAGTLFALLQHPSPVNLGITALLTSYAAVLFANINWSAALFVDSRLAEGQVRREIAAREAAQAQAAHAERMTALGELAGGVAHDINNILQVVSGSVARIERRPDNRDEVARQATRIQQAVDRGGAISRRLLAFARRDSLRSEPIDAHGLLTEVGELIADAIGPSIRIHVQAGEGAGSLLADRRQLETVLLNLATNARDAMPDGGDLTLSAAGTVLERDSDSPRLAAGRYVRLVVADTGAGIDPADLARVVEPFFTTKPRGKGTGLGLSMAKGFAEQSGGALSVESEPGRGTTVTLWIPQADASLKPPDTVSRQDVRCPALDGDGRRVLVVDDDEQVRDGLMSSLQDAGFATIGAEDAAAALGQLDRGAQVDALVTDFAMPGLNGLDLIHEVHARRPGLPAILLTGDLQDLAPGAFTRLNGEPFSLLRKPTPPTRVAEQLAELIARAAP